MVFRRRTRTGGVKNISKFYTCVGSRGDKVLVRGYEDGKRFKETVHYEPYLFVPSKEESPYHLIDGTPVQRVDLNCMRDAQDMIKQNSGISNAKLYGATDFKYSYLYDAYKGEIDFDFSLLNVISVDIETDMSNGYGIPGEREITDLTLCRRIDGDSITFSTINYTKGDNKHKFVFCKDEKALLTAFLYYWKKAKWNPDILTGWNTAGFDIPVIVKRCIAVLEENEYLELSPFGYVKPRIFKAKRTLKDVETYDIVGVSALDYMEAYQKFAPSQREQYTLKFISQFELGDTKVDYAEYGSLYQLRCKNPELFVEYNIKDADLINRLEDKLHYIEQIVTMAYIIKCNYENIMFTVKPWDVLVINYLMDRNIVVPFFEESRDKSTIVGGFVKEPKPGLYEYIVTLDYTSLYPSVAMSFNISPDTLYKKLDKKVDMKDIIYGDITNFTEELKKRDYAMTANGCLFRRDKRGFVPDIMKFFFEERKRYRKMEAAAKKEYEGDPKNITKRNLFLKYKNLQTAFKLLNNSGYGALVNKFCRWFDNRLGEAITLTGQMASKNVAYGINTYLNKVFETTNVDYIIYQDTDSAYLNMKPLVDKMGITDTKKGVKACLKFTEEFLQPEVQRVCEVLCAKLNAFDPVISMKLEKICEQGFFIMKKRYALNVTYDEGLWNEKAKLKVVGLDPVRSSVPQICRDEMRNIYSMIFAKDQEGIYQHIEDFKEKFYTMSFDKIGTSTGCNGLIKYYNAIKLYELGTPIKVKGAIFYNSLLKERGLDKQYETIYDGDKVRYCYLKRENPTRQEVLSVKGDCPKELDLEKYIDYDHQWDKTFMKPIQTVLDVVGYQSAKVGNLIDIFGV